MGIIETLENIKFLDIPLFNWSTFSVLFLRYAITVIVTTILVRLYYKFSKNKEFLFTFFAFNTLIFFMVYMMNNVDVGIGFGFGLFAVFSILRYRTITVHIKEMTYLFMVITVAVINALITPNFSYIELFLANGLIIAMTYLLEKLMVRQTLSVYDVIYEKIENITPENRGALEKDLRERTGLNITDIEIRNIDFLRDVVNIKLYYDQNDQPGVKHSIDE